MNRFAIVTPSFNQGKYLPETIDSVLCQKGDFAIDYIVIDGGSTDGSVEILQAYEEKIKNGLIEKKCHEFNFRWLSERDNGQYDAINKGFGLVDGNIMAWINSDDKYTPWAFSVVSRIITLFPEVEWLSSLRPLLWNNHGEAIVVGDYDGFDKKSFFKGKNLCTGKWYNGNWIAQDSTFWTRSLWDRSGGLSDNYDYAADFLLWVRFYKNTELYGVNSSLAGYRYHEEQKTAQQNVYNSQAEEIFFNNGGRPYSKIESFCREKLLINAIRSRILKKCLHKTGLLNTARNFKCLNRIGKWEMYNDPVV